MTRDRPLRVLVTPREIAGVAAGLQRVLEADGAEVDVLLRWPHPFGYRYRPSASGAVRLLGRLALEPFDEPAGRLRRAVSLVARFLALPLIRLRYDTVVYLGPDTLLRGGPDRRWLTGTGLRTVSVFLGSDARPPYLDGAFARGDTEAELDAVRDRVGVTREQVRRAERDSTYLVNQPGTGQFHTRPYVDWTLLGYPSPDAHEDAPDRPVAQSSRPFTMLHAPSDPLMKGTDTIRAAVARVVDAGADIDYVEISGRPHAEVLDAIRSADLVVDQLYSDVLLPGLATEAARLGTPVVVFGYSGELIRSVCERGGLQQLHYDHPDRLEQVLERLVRDPAALRELSESLHAMVRGPWSTDGIGGRWGALVAGRPEQVWFDQPDAAPYAHGCAIAADRLVDFLGRYVARHGPAGLGLDQAPGTQAAVLALAADFSDEASGPA